MITYSVTRSFPSEQQALDWIVWVKEDHVRRILGSGASRIEVVQLRGATKYQLRYEFETEQHFDYCREQAGQDFEHGDHEAIEDLGNTKPKKLGPVVFSKEVVAV